MKTLNSGPNLGKISNRNISTFILFFVASILMSACWEEDHGRCAKNSELDENIEWVWIYENAGVAENRKCIVCYLDETNPDNRCFYAYSLPGTGNMTKEICKVQACSDDPNTNDPHMQGHGGTKLINKIYSDYEKEKK